MSSDRCLTESCSVEVIQTDTGRGDSNISLDGYYTIKLGLTGDRDYDIDRLYEFYNDNMYDKTDPKIIKDTLHEYITMFNNRGLNGTELIAEKISMVGRKTSREKKNINYFVGCLRNILEYGVSTTGSFIEKRLISAFENAYGTKLSAWGIQKLLALSTRNSTADVLLAIMENNINAEELLMEKFETCINSWKES